MNTVINFSGPIKSREFLEDDCLLGCCAVYSGRSLATFQWCLPPSFGQ
jgi:hypothetical protein